MSSRQEGIRNEQVGHQAGHFITGQNYVPEEHSDYFRKTQCQTRR